MQKIIMNKHPDTSKEGNYIYLLLPQIYFYLNSRRANNKRKR